MSHEVRILKDIKTMEYESVPPNELPPGLFKIMIMDRGDFYVTKEQLGQFKKPDYRHGEFPEEVRAVLPRFQVAFAGVYDLSLDEWEDGFRRDIHPWQEIAYWDMLSDGMEKFAGHLRGSDLLTKQKKLEVYQTLTRLQNLPDSSRIAFKKGKVNLPATGNLTSSRIMEIAKWYFNDARSQRILERTEELRKILEPEGPEGPDRISLSALLNEEGTGLNESAPFSARDLFAAPDVILSVDVESDHEFVVFGRDKVTGDSIEEGCRVLRIEIDQDTDELEQLCFWVQVIRGRHEYQSD